MSETIVIECDECDGRGLVGHEPRLDQPTVWLTCLRCSGSGEIHMSAWQLEDLRDRLDAARAAIRRRLK